MTLHPAAPQPAAFWTITEQGTDRSELFHLTGSKAEDLDVVMTVDKVDVEKQQQAVDCSVTHREAIEAHQGGAAGARRNIPREAVFEICQEAHEPPLTSLCERLRES